MLLSITTTHQPATDLGYLLGKHPERPQSFELAYVHVHVFYPEASAERCTVCLLLDIDPIGPVRTYRHGPARRSRGCSPTTTWRSMTQGTPASTRSRRSTSASRSTTRGSPRCVRRSRLPARGASSISVAVRADSYPGSRAPASSRRSSVSTCRRVRSRSRASACAPMHCRIASASASRCSRRR